ncbi:ABC transporter ATP-binding protein [Plebeiibacterium sediminum]|uniref:ABC transporter ATP-binding protein n=1 Tax=Plebeiibacterium sediminum TaxID=2992112 RepID=A0AAE3M649_9BACT|nr:ABC transporter ATP-binding protein [Plebeiobacterium sediminum]MCW3787834.1 ABC transporter ATP-binding protein [Plebeiobacterium sediminum]
MISAQGIEKQFGDLKVLKGVDLTVKQGEVVSIVGPSGAGKTTLLQILGTLDKPNSGSVFINDTEIQSLREKELARFRNENIGFVFQFHQLLPEFTAVENIILPALIAGKNKSKSEKKAREILNFLNLKDREHHKPAELSGGEKQRIAIARALINDPDVVFADEPTGSLDSKNQEELQKLFFSLRDEFNQTFVIVTHDLHLAHLSDREIKMKDGIVI